MVKSYSDRHHQDSMASRNGHPIYSTRVSSCHKLHSLACNLSHSRVAAQHLCRSRPPSSPVLTPTSGSWSPEHPRMNVHSKHQYR